MYVYIDCFASYIQDCFLLQKYFFKTHIKILTVYYIFMQVFQSADADKDGSITMEDVKLLDEKVCEYMLLCGGMSK